MNEKEFIAELLKLNINLDNIKLQKLNKFYELLLQWNEKINLTTITIKKDVYLKHFYDSLTLVKAIDLNNSISILDVGTGAGFPGIVLKIVFPNLKITLLDSQAKRINYLKEIINELNLKDIEVICSRSEIYTKANPLKYDIIVSRAVANLKILTEITFQGLKVNGYLIAMKAIVDDEIESSLDIIQKLNGKIVDIIKFKLPIENSSRTLVKIEKIGITNKKYPRRYSEIKKSI